MSRPTSPHARPLSRDGGVGQARPRLGVLGRPATRPLAARRAGATRPDLYVAPASAAVAAADADPPAIRRRRELHRAARTGGRAVDAGLAPVRVAGLHLRRRRLTAAPAPRLCADADRRADRRGRRALLLLRVLPAADGRGRAQPRPRARRALAAEPDVRLGHLRRGGQHDRAAQDDRDRQAPQARLRHGGDGPFHVRRRDDRSSCARCSTRCATPASRTCSRCAATRRPARTSGSPTEGGLSYSRELIELIRDEYEFSIGAACFPEVHIHATDAESDLRYSRRRSTPARAS